jgi:hypothetical protein
MVSDLREDMVALRTDMNRRFEQVDQRFLHLEDKMDRRFEQVDRRFDSIDAKLTKYFVWTAGMFVTTLVAIFGAFGAMIAGGFIPR